MGIPPVKQMDQNENQNKNQKLSAPRAPFTKEFDQELNMILSRRWQKEGRPRTLSLDEGMQKFNVTKNEGPKNSKVTSAAKKRFDSLKNIMNIRSKEVETKTTTEKKVERKNSVKPEKENPLLQGVWSDSQEHLKQIGKTGLILCLRLTNDQEIKGEFYGRVAPLGIRRGYLAIYPNRESATSELELKFGEFEFRLARKKEIQELNIRFVNDHQHLAKLPSRTYLEDFGSEK